MYKIKMLCFDSKIGVKPYEDAPLNPYFDTEEEAYAKALELAEEEAEGLNKGCDENVSFGVVEDEKDNSIRVLYYYMDGPTDTTGNTEQVTTYWVEQINEEERLRQGLDKINN